MFWCRQSVEGDRRSSEGRVDVGIIQLSNDDKEDDDKEDDDKEDCVEARVHQMQGLCGAPLDLKM